MFLLNATSVKQLLATSTGNTAAAGLPPADVIIEVVIAFFVVLGGLLASTTQFQPIKLSEELSLRYVA